MQRTPFEAIALKTIENELAKACTEESVLQKISSAANVGSLAFFPCNKCFRKLLARIQHRMPAVYKRIFGVIDLSRNISAPNGISIFHVDDLPLFINELSTIVIASNNFPVIDCNRLQKQAELPTHINYIYISDFDLTLPPSNSINGLISQISRIYTCLADWKSKMMYLTVWLYRVLKDDKLSYIFANDCSTPSGDSLFYKGSVISNFGDDYSNKEDILADVYRIPEVDVGLGETVLDVGAYIGDTAIYFSHHVGATGKVYAFEPILANYEKLMRNVKDNCLDSIIIPVHKGCGSGNRVSRAVSSANGSSWAFIDAESGSQSIQIVTIDSFVDEHKLDKVSFIKMDIEGYECEALKGAIRTIKKYRPKLAICLYHQTRDLIEIPDFILSLPVKYDLYFRSQKAGPYGTVLFCSPKGDDE